MKLVQKSSHVEVVVDATVEQVWDVVSDVTRVGEWSHECRGAEWLGGADRAVAGARFRGTNRQGWARWSRTSEILALDPPHEIVWRTVPMWLLPDSTEWRIKVDAAEGGARITQRFRVLRAPAFHDRLFAQMLPAHQDRDERLREDLARIGQVARSGSQG